jgi:uncharacterized protein involved in outer membrane biogenesis
LSKNLKRWFIGAAVIVALMAVLFLFIRAALEPTRVKRYVEERLAEAVDLPVRVGHDFNLSLFPLVELTLAQLEVRNHSFQDPLLFAENITLGLDFRKLLTGQVDIRQLSLKRPVLILEKDRDGWVNWADDDQEPEKNRGETGDYRLGLFPVVSLVKDGDIKITDGVFRWRDRSRENDAEWTGVTVRIDELILDPDLVPPISDPVAWTGGVLLDGQATVETGRINNFHFSSLNVVLACRNGRLHFFPSDVSLYGGNLALDITMTPQHDGRYRWSSRIEARNIQAGPLLQALFGFTCLEGRMDGNLNVTWSGLNQADMVASSRGRGKLVLRDGYVVTDVKTDLPAEDQRRFRNNNDRSGPDERIDFTTLIIEVDVTDGIVRLTSIVLEHPAYSAVGHGTIDPVGKRVDISTDVVVDAHAGAGETPAPSYTLHFFNDDRCPAARIQPLEKPGGNGSEN